MRGHDGHSGTLFRYIYIEERVPSDHPLPVICLIVNDFLTLLSLEFDALHSNMGRPGIAPERMLRALLLQAFYTIRSERQLMEQLDFNMLSQWFVGLGLDEPVWDAATFYKNRDRLLEADVSAKLLAGVVEHKKLRSSINAF